MGPMADSVETDSRSQTDGWREDQKRGGERRAPTPPVREAARNAARPASDDYCRNAPLGEPQAICGVRWSTLLSVELTNVFAKPAE